MNDRTPSSIALSWFLLGTLCWELTACAVPLRISLYQRPSGFRSVNSITINQTSMALSLNEFLVLTAKADPPTTPVQWLSSNPAVATVDDTGRVTGLSVGTATIMAASKDMTVRSSCLVRVYDMNNSSSVPLVGGAPVRLGDTTSLSGATMAVDPDSGAVYVAYANNVGAGLVFKSLLGSGQWTQVGPPFAAPSPSFPISDTREFNISLAVNQGSPYVAYLDGTNSGRSLVKKFDGSDWVTVGGTFVSVADASYLSLAFDSSNHPFLGEIDANSGAASVLRFIAGTWSSIGASSLNFSTSGSSCTSVAFDASGLLSGGTGDDYFVAYNDSSDGPEVGRFPSRTIFSNEIGSPYTTMVIVNGVMYVAYQDGLGGTAQLHVEHPAPEVDHATYPMSTTEADYIALAVDPRNGTAYVAYANKNATAPSSPIPSISEIRAGTTDGLPGTVLANTGDYDVDGITLAFYVDSTGHGHLFACYGIKGTAPSNGGLFVKEYAR